MWFCGTICHCFQKPHDQASLKEGNESPYPLNNKKIILRTQEKGALISSTRTSINKQTLFSLNEWFHTSSSVCNVMESMRPSFNKQTSLSLTEWINISSSVGNVMISMRFSIFKLTCCLLQNIPIFLSGSVILSSLWALLFLYGLISAVHKAIVTATSNSNLIIITYSIMPKMVIFYSNHDYCNIYFLL